MIPVAPLMIHKSEWERLQKQARPASPDTNEVPCQDVEAMIAQSQKWINAWPDSVQAHVNKVRMKKKKMHLEEIAEVNAFHKKKLRDTTAENLKRARDLIFERTGYGRELLSALIESKTLEERELQIKFKKEIKEKEQKVEEVKSKVDNIMYAEFENGERKRILQKEKERTDAECNKMISDMKKQEAIRAAEIEKTNRQKDGEIIEKLNQLQILEEKHNYCLDEHIQDVKIYEEQNKVIKEMREKRELLDQVLADVWCKHQDRVRCREKQVFEQIYKEKDSRGHFKENYELVKRLQEEEQKKYDDFIDKGVKRAEKRFKKKEKEEKLKTDQQQNIKPVQAECTQFRSQRNDENYNRRICADRQSFLRTSKRERIDTKLPRDCPRRADFLSPSRALSCALARRRAAPGGWGGAGAAHARFARHAADTLQEAAYKRPVWKVIHSYQKKNNLKDLDIPN